MTDIQRRLFLTCLAALPFVGLPKAGADESPLRARARAKGLFFGCAVQSRQLNADQDFAEAVARECDLLIPEWEMKWAPMASGPRVMNFSKPDALLDFATKHDQRLHGHVTVWHRSVPDWATEAFRKGQGKEVFDDAIRQMVSHYKGRLHSMGLVNEAIDTSNLFGGIYRDSVFYETFGKEYIGRAFSVAKEADPGARFYYSDFGVDYDDRVSQKRRAASLTILSELKSAGVPVHGYAIQGHLRVGRHYNAKVHRDYLAELAALDLDLIVSEFDVNDKDLNVNVARRDLGIATHAKAYLDTLFDEKRVLGLACWGLSTRYSWLNTTKFYSRGDGERTRGLPLDDDMKPTPLWHAIAAALDGAPVR